jgi:hypothetical protein
MTDDQFKQLMDKLDDIARRLPPLPAPPMPLPGQCYFCGSWHGGLMCPQLVPICTGENLHND